MTLRIAFTRPDGGVSIVSAAPKPQIERTLGPLTDSEYLQHVLARSIPPEASDVSVLADAWAPPDIDREFRNAWRHTGGAFRVDMPHARDLHREKMRRARKPLMEALDIEYMRLDEAGDSAGKVKLAQNKQKLRDVTADPAIEAAQTPAELRAVWPKVLEGDFGV